jgi:hypothetical protein
MATPITKPKGPEPFVLDAEQDRKLVDFALEAHRHYKDRLKLTHERMVMFWEKYHSRRPDPRDPVTESWRAHIVVPQAYYNVEAKAAQMLEILMGADPPIQADPMFESREDESRGIEDLLDYTLRINYFRKFIVSQSRATSVQGTSFFKSMWRKRTIMVPRRTTIEQLKYFQDKLQEALQTLNLPQTTIPDWMRNPGDFEAWRKKVNDAYPNVNLPPAPDLSGKPQEVVTFWGPYIESIPPWQVFLNPNIQEIADQPVVIHEYWKPKSWLLSLTGENELKPFHPAQVEMAMEAWSAESSTDEQASLNLQRAIPDDVQSDPTYEEPVNILEVWRLGSEFPFQMILNRKAVINKNPRVLPFEHGQIPIGMIRNVLLPGMAFGVSDIDPAFSLLEEQDIFRSLRLDKATIHTLPIFKKLPTFGLAELQKKLKPGGIIEVSNMNAISELVSGDVNPGAFSEANNISGNIDQTFGIDASVRGNQATINRVPATESQNRRGDAQIRLKMGAIQFEDDLNPHVGQWLGMWRQFGSVENRPTVGGYDPLADIPAEKLTVSLAQDYRFRGATQALSRELQAQQLTMFGKEFKELMLPTEMRELMRQVGIALGLRSLAKIVSPQGDQMMMQSFMAQKQAESAQNKASQTQNTQITESAAAPSEIPID